MLDVAYVTGAADAAESHRGCVATRGRARGGRVGDASARRGAVRTEGKRIRSVISER